MSNELWVMSDEWWVMSDENWVTKKVCPNKLLVSLTLNLVVLRGNQPPIASQRELFKVLFFNESTLQSVFSLIPFSLTNRVPYIVA